MTQDVTIRVYAGEETPRFLYEGGPMTARLEHLHRLPATRLVADRSVGTGWEERRWRRVLEYTATAWGAPVA